MFIIANTASHYIAQNYPRLKSENFKFDPKRRHHILTLPRSDRRSVSWRKPSKCHDILCYAQSVGNFDVAECVVKDTSNMATRLLQVWSEKPSNGNSTTKRRIKITIASLNSFMHSFVLIEATKIIKQHRQKQWLRSTYKHKNTEELDRQKIHGENSTIKY